MLQGWRLGLSKPVKVALTGKEAWEGFHSSCAGSNEAVGYSGLGLRSEALSGHFTL